MAKNRFYEEYLKELPDGLRKATGNILLKFHGSDRPVNRTRLVMLVARDMRLEYHNDKQFMNIDRRVRRVIETLRGAGWLIGSTLSGDGYFMITNMQEYDQFRAQYTSSAYQVIKTADTMDLAARRLFGKPEEVQLELIKKEG